MISLIHSLILTYTYILKVLLLVSRNEKENSIITEVEIKKLKPNVFATSMSRDVAAGVLKHWLTAYLFRMMKIFPSRQPFVLLVTGTACQICFSSCLHNATTTHVTVCLPPTDYNRCAAMRLWPCNFSLSETKKITFGCNAHRVLALHSSLLSHLRLPKH